MAVIGAFSNPDEAQDQGGSGMVWATRNATVTLLRDLFSDWQPSKQAWPINYGFVLCGTAAGASGLISCLALSKHLELWRHKWTVRFFPLPLSILVPAAISATCHNFLVTNDIILQETACPVCVETRAISLQVALGAIFPAVAAFGGTLVIGQQVTSTSKYLKWMPRTLPQLFSFAKSTVLKHQPFLLGTTALNLLLAGGLVYAEVKSYEEVMLELEKRVEEGSKGKAPTRLGNYGKDITSEHFSENPSLTILQLLQIGNMGDDVALEEEEKKRDFTQTMRMRSATRKVHDTSDALVNAKLGATMSDDSVWAEGLLVFYEIFKFLEEALERHKDSLIGDLLIPGMARTTALEADLAHYLGEEWQKDYVIRDEVAGYLEYLNQIEESDPYLLCPYIYHLYMGLFSGGQVLKAKRMLSLSSITSSKEEDEGGEKPGYSVTSYGEISIGSLKRQLKKAMNELAENLDEDTREKILVESVKVFELNNVIIGSVKGVDRVLKRRMLKLLIAVILLLLFVFACYFKSEEDEL